METTAVNWNVVITASSAAELKQKLESAVKEWTGLSAGEQLALPLGERVEREERSVIDTAQVRRDLAAQVAPAPAKRGRKPKAQVEAAAANADFDLGGDGVTQSDEPAATDGGDDFDLGDEDTSTESAPALTYEQIVAEFQHYARATSREQAGLVLKEFGVKAVKDLKPETYPAVIKRMTNRPVQRAATSARAAH